MKKISIISFTGNGTKLCDQVNQELKTLGYETSAFAVKDYINGRNINPLDADLNEWTKEQFKKSDGILFIGAAGIAVRAIAPYVEDKTKDPAVIVIDEKAGFVIPVLSGHIGGANDLAREIAQKFNSIPVITTATDRNHLFAVDEFAVKNNLYLLNMDAAKKISVRLLRGEMVGFVSDFKTFGSLPPKVMQTEYCECGICISLNGKKKPFPETLNLIPRAITLGIGCKKGKSLEDIEAVVYEVLNWREISIHAIQNLATIDLKKEEKGFIDFCKKYNLKMDTYAASSLEKVPGRFSESEYVKKVTGIGNVCERAALIGSNYGVLIQEKFVKDGITVCLAGKEQVIEFE